MPDYVFHASVSCSGIQCKDLFSPHLETTSVQLRGKERLLGIRSCNRSLTVCANKNAITIRSFFSPHLKHMRIHISTVLQANEYRISVYSGSSAIGSAATSAASAASKANRIPQTDCPTDVIRIFDGSTPSTSSMIAQFCGSGHLPPVKSSGSQILVTLSSASQSVMSDSRFELDVQIELLPISETRNKGRIVGRCDYLFDGSLTRSGIISSPSYSLPANTSCSYTFQSDRPEDRIWFFFVSYYVQDLNEWGNEERCDVSELQLQGVLEPERQAATASTACNQTSSLKLDSSSSSSVDHSLSFLPASLPSSSSSSLKVYRFCEKSSPRVCGRSSDSETQQHHSTTPCTFPGESYLSSGSKMTIKQHYYKATAFLPGSGTFVARYEFVDTTEFGDPVDGTVCDRWIFSHKQSSGDIRSTRNTFLFGRSGRSRLSCSYHFVGKKNERLRIRFNSVKLDSSHCRNKRDPRNGMISCLQTPPDSIGSREKLATLTVIDSIKSEQIIAGCLCSSEMGRELIFDVIGPEVIVNLTITGMDGRDDFNKFSFDASYEFWPGNDMCSSNAVVQQKDGREGEVSLNLSPHHAPHLTTQDSMFKCRWLIQGSQGKHLYLKFHGFIPK